jgi:hypothetical protein
MKTKINPKTCLIQVYVLNSCNLFSLKNKLFFLYAHLKHVVPVQENNLVLRSA